MINFAHREKCPLGAGFSYKICSNNFREKNAESQPFYKSSQKTRFQFRKLDKTRLCLPSVISEKRIVRFKWIYRANPGKFRFANHTKILGHASQRPSFSSMLKKTASVSGEIAWYTVAKFMFVKKKHWSTWQHCMPHVVFVHYFLFYTTTPFRYLIYVN